MYKYLTKSIKICDIYLPNYIMLNMQTLLYDVYLM